MTMAEKPKKLFEIDTINAKDKFMILQTHFVDDTYETRATNGQNLGYLPEASIEKRKAWIRKLLEKEAAAKENNRYLTDAECWLIRMHILEEGLKDPDGKFLSDVSRRKAEEKVRTLRAAIEKSDDPNGNNAKRCLQILSYYHIPDLRTRRAKFGRWATTLSSSAGGFTGGLYVATAIYAVATGTAFGLAATPIGWLILGGALLFGIVFTGIYFLSKGVESFSSKAPSKKIDEQKEVIKKVIKTQIIEKHFIVDPAKEKAERAAIAELTTELKVVKGQNEDLAAEVKTVKGQNEELAAELGAVKEQNVDLATEVKAVKEQNVRLEGKVDTLTTKLETLEQTTLPAQFKILKDLIDKLPTTAVTPAQIEALSGKIVGLEGQIAGLATTAKVSEQVEQLSGKIEGIQTTLADIKLAVSTLEGAQISKEDFSHLKLAVQNIETGIVPFAKKLALRERAEEGDETVYRASETPAAKEALLRHSFLAPKDPPKHSDDGGGLSKKWTKK